MLADRPIHYAAGALEKTVQAPDAFSREVIEFIAEQLPRWKHRLTLAERCDSEVLLTDKLRSHLNSASRHTVGMDVVQFATEVPDERVRGRLIDLGAKPCGVVLVIQGRAYVDFETILPIECKRLPIPQGKDRDEREYLFSAYSTTGGIQRFKIGAHASAHNRAAMIAYVQEGAVNFWQERFHQWISGLVQEFPSQWNFSDLLHPLEDRQGEVFRLQSQHARNGGLAAISLDHLWISMN